MTAERSTSLKVERMAAVFCASTSLWAIRFRMGEMGLRVTRFPSFTLLSGISAGDSSFFKLSTLSFGVFCSKMSFLVILPSLPVPTMVVGSNPVSAKSFFTAGECLEMLFMGSGLASVS